MQAVEVNWAGNFAYGAERIYHPETIGAVQEIVAQNRRARALGSRHSFNAIADTPGALIALDRLNRILSLDREAGTVTVEGGVLYGDLCSFLHAEGYALHNMASLPHISVAGACATATHGSGDGNPCLATAVAALDIVRADGGLATISRSVDPDRFAAAAVGLGALGVVVRMTLDLQPTFDVYQEVFDGLDLSAAVDNFDRIMGSAYSVSLFTDWTGDRINQVWRKQKVTAEMDPPVEQLFGSRLAAAGRHPIDGVEAVNCTEQRRLAGPWHERLPHFRMEFTPSVGEELQTEYLVPRPHAAEALLALASLRGRIAPLLLIQEVRTVAADDLWMSPFYSQPCAAFHFTWKPDWPSVRELLPVIEAALLPLGARPHWGKLFTISPDTVRALYSRLAEFQAVVREFDPYGKFVNPFMAEYLGL